jgi:hypothetical protein
VLPKRLNKKGKLIKVISTYRTWYKKGIEVMSVIRNMEMSDLAILMAATKYLFGEYIPTFVIVLLGVGYWVFNAILNCSVGWFWEKNDGWRIEAEVFGKRNAVSRTVLVSPEGDSYDARETLVKER